MRMVCKKQVRGTRCEAPEKSLEPRTSKLVPWLLICALSTASNPAFAGDCPTTLITLAPSLAELAFEAGAGDCLAGVVAYSDRPPEARDLPVIGDAFQYDLERIMALSPGHALAWQGGSPPARVAQLEALGIDVTWIRIRVLDDIPRALTTIGALAGNPAKAAAAAEDFTTRRQVIEAGAGAGPPVRVFYQVSRQPLFTLGARHVITDVIEQCGGENVFADLHQEAAAVDFEPVIAADPDIIIAGEAPGEHDPLAAWTQFGSISAVENGHLYTVDPDLLVRPTAGILEGSAWLCERIEEISRENANNQDPSGTRSRK